MHPLDRYFWKDGQEVWGSDPDRSRQASGLLPLIADHRLIAWPRQDTKIPGNGQECAHVFQAPFHQPAGLPDIPPAHFAPTPPPPK
ncbi:hypothetical protein R1flu_013114 [Riccia fluitans]|uniref:Uncharacterized protein n=1 Tax=Riccia fluitans TaxID=41844 RepID=A0ABD1ZGJ9_9MARC